MYFKNIRKYLVIILLIIGVGCNKEASQSEPQEQHTLYLGADLSYVNEMLDCGGEFRVNGQPQDPYQIFANKGANIVRVRLWHNPTWTAYSKLDDVTKTIRSSKEKGMVVLLDFHYSDDWADPNNQVIPEAWKHIDDINILADSVYSYTYKTLEKLYHLKLLPEMVQIGNEINNGLLSKNAMEDPTPAINWTNTITLLNKGLEAVNNFNETYSRTIATMLHVAQPENTFWWFDAAFANGISDFDWIGLSYYPKWSAKKIDELPQTLQQIKEKYSKRIMIVETAYPYSLVASDEANNILMEDALIDNYPATKEGQLNYMLDLTTKTIEGGGEGVIYWEPAWISTNCSTRWGIGSHWENATFFDAENNNEALPVFNYYNKTNYN